MEDHRFIKIIGIILIISSSIFLIFSVVFAYDLRLQRVRYLKRNNIYHDTFYVETDDVTLRGALYVDYDLLEKDEKTVPSILMINGINARKEYSFDKVFQLVKFDYAVFVVEQRGHGESGGPSGFLSKEPKDMQKVIDFIEDTYDFADTDHLGLLAFSYGGGVGAILQAKDDRIYASVLYHPLTSLEGVTERIPFQNLVGTTTVIKDIDEIDDAMDIADKENTKNLLIIQGMNDKIITPEESEDFYEHLDGKSRYDIGLEKRPELDHGENEKNEESFKYALVWFEHFYHDSTINITDRDEEIKDVSLEKFEYPYNPYSEIFLFISVITLFIGISILVIFFLILPIWKNKPFQNISIDTPDKHKRYKKMIILRTFFYISPVLIAGFLFSIFSPSLMYGYFVFYPIITTIIMLFIPSELHSNWKSEWKKWIKNDSKIFLISFFTILIPVLVFISIFSLNALLMFKPTIPFWNTTLVVYLFIFFGSVIMDFLYLREWKPRHTFILIIIRPITLIIFVFFIPIKPFPLLGGITSFILFFILIGVLFWYVRQFSLVMSKYFKNTVSTYALIFFPVIIIMLYLFFRIL
jgi:alpha-beta hydrolase superfamily lysophospholipase